MIICLIYFICGIPWWLWHPLTIVESPDHCGMPWLWHPLTIVESPDHCGIPWSLWNPLIIVALPIINISNTIVVECLLIFYPTSCRCAQLALLVHMDYLFSSTGRFYYLASCIWYDICLLIFWQTKLCWCSGDTSAHEIMTCKLILLREIFAGITILWNFHK